VDNGSASAINPAPNSRSLETSEELKPRWLSAAALCSQRRGAGLGGSDGVPRKRGAGAGWTTPSTSMKLARMTRRLRELHTGVTEASPFQKISHHSSRVVLPRNAFARQRRSEDSRIPSRAKRKFFANAPATVRHRAEAANVGSKFRKRSPLFTSVLIQRTRLMAT